MQRTMVILLRLKDWVLGLHAAGSGHAVAAMSRVTGVRETNNYAE